MNIPDKEHYEQLVKEVNRLRNLAHLFDTQEISEAALDELKHQITLYEQTYPEQISKDSPNTIIAGGVASEFTKFTHTRRMLSLNDIFDKQELIEWEQRYKDHGLKVGVVVADKPRYILEPKIDGLAIALHYLDGELQTAVTRGDGWSGENVTQNVRQIRAIPNTIEYKGKLEVRGEVFITKKDFDLLNQSIAEGLKPGKMGKFGSEYMFANSRNAAAGTLRQLDSSIVGERNLSFIAYNAFVHNSK
jgi:DNA ligase (NAD+)